MSDFRVTNFLKESIDKYKNNPSDKNIFYIHGALIGYINGDPKFKTNDFDDAIKYTISQGIKESDLFENFDSSKEIEDDKSKWDEDYYSHELLYLQENFCKKRINHIKEVAKHLYGESNNGNKSSSNNSSTSSLSLLKDISSYINTISKSESSIIKEIQLLKKNSDIDMKNVTKAVTYIEKQYNLVLKYYTNKFKSIIKE